MAAETLEREDVQGLVMRGYGNLPLARYDVGTIVDPARARAWLRGLRADTGLGRPAGTAVNVAFTAPGLAKLGVPGGAWSSSAASSWTG